ncbi:hypothetical protein CG473_03170 [Mycoplasma testudineum]|nr:hypothetical protein CG473_03170 [Mycoplasma testudineum]
MDLFDLIISLTLTWSQIGKITIKLQTNEITNKTNIDCPSFEFFSLIITAKYIYCAIAAIQNSIPNPNVAVAGTHK